jgi:hypothetical protein
LTSAWGARYIPGARTTTLSSRAPGHQAAANFDGDGFSYSEQALAAEGISPGGAVTSGGVRYTWPSVAAGQPDNVLAGGQTSKLLPVSGATKIGVIGSASNGPSTGQMTITYSDGTTQQVSLVLSDWTLNASGAPPADGNIETASTPYRNSVRSSTDDQHLPVLGQLPGGRRQDGCQRDAARID